jgi:hypothetical protein
MGKRLFAGLVCVTRPVHIGFSSEEFRNRAAFILTAPTRVNHALDGPEPSSMGLAFVDSPNRFANFSFVPSGSVRKVERAPGPSERLKVIGRLAV